MTCPRCGEPAFRALYLGLPLKVCADSDDCGCIWGFWSFALFFQVNDGGWALMSYEGVPYWRALWHWLRGEATP